MSVYHVARSRHRLRTRCGQPCMDLEVVEVSIARDPTFWIERTHLRTRMKVCPAICVACVALHP